MDNLALYIGIFAIIFLPYMFISFFMSVQKIRLNVRSGMEELPVLFRCCRWVVMFFEDNVSSLVSHIAPQAHNKMTNLLIIADMNISAGYVFSLQIVLAMVLFCIAFFMCLLTVTDAWISLGAGFFGGAVGFLLPSGIVKSTGKNRQEEITRSLPFSIDLIGAAMRSGIDFGAAIRYYVKAENPKNPLVREYSRMLQELELGKTRLEALDAMACRIQTEEFFLFSAAVCHGLEVGSSIVNTMKVQGEEMRRRRFNLAERKAARAASAMVIPIMTLILPAMFIVIGTPVVMRLFDSGIGAYLK